MCLNNPPSLPWYSPLLLRTPPCPLLSSSVLFCLSYLSSILFIRIAPKMHFLLIPLPSIPSPSWSSSLLSFYLLQSPFLPPLMPTTRADYSRHHFNFMVDNGLPSLSWDLCQTSKKKSKKERKRVMSCWRGLTHDLKSSPVLSIAARHGMPQHVTA